MSRRDEAAEQTRTALLDAGLTVAERVGLSGMSVNRVVAEAGLAKGTFYVHFKDRAAFLAALHARWHDQMTQEVMAAIGDIEPGLARLRVAITTYLDACLRGAAVKALLLEARNETSVADQVALRNEAFAEFTAPDLRAMGWRHPVPAARMLIAMGAETALVELMYGKRHPTSRSVLWQMFERADLAAAAGT